MKNSSILLLSMVAGILVVGTRAAQAGLSVGDPAPKLRVGNWIQGGPISPFDTNHIYIVEFWATWCGPCRMAIPHLNDLWQRFKDKGVIVIGQDVMDQDDKVASIVKKMGGDMTYPVALDDKRQETNGFMAVNWLKSSDQRSLPATIVVDQLGRVIWTGSPFALSADVVSDLLHQADSPVTRAEYEKQKAEEQNETELVSKLDGAVAQEKWDQAELALDEILSKVPRWQQNDYICTVFARPNTEAFLSYRLRILLGRKKYTDAYKLAESYYQNHANGEDSFKDVIADFAWIIATQKGVEERNLALAEKLASRANLDSNGNAPYILNTLARIQFLTGKTREAIATEQKAVEIAASQNNDQIYAQALAAYKAGKLP